MPYPSVIDEFNSAVDSWQGVLGGTITSTSTSISLSAGSNAGALPETGVISIGSEHIRYISRTVGAGGSGTLNATGGRGYGSTVAQPHSSGDLVQRRIIADDVNALQTAITSLELYNGLYKTKSLNPAAMGSFAQVDSIFTIDKDHRTMKIDFEIVREFTDATEPIYSTGTIWAVRTTLDGDSLQEGAVDIDDHTYQGGIIGANYGITFAMSDDGEDDTTLWYKTANIPATESIAFKGKVFIFE